MAVRRMLLELGDAYEQRSGLRVRITSVGGVDAARRIREGEAFDFAVLASEAIDALAEEGHVDADSRTEVARSGIAVAVAAGAAGLDVSSESAIREAVLRARAIGYSTGPSGAHVMRLFTRWGIADAIAKRLVQAAPGIGVGELVARGEVALGFQQLSELMHVPGIDVVGPLPPAVQAATVFSAAVCKAATHAEHVRPLLAFLASPDAAAAKRRNGMEPA